MKKLMSPSFQFTSDKYCSFVNKLKYGCMQQNLLEMWDARNSINFTHDEILHKLSSTQLNQVTGHETNFTLQLSGIETDSHGNIVSARSLLTSYFVFLNFTEVDINKVGNIAGTADWATIDIMNFEAKFSETMRRLKSELETDDIKIYYGTGRSYGDISSKALMQDLSILFLGIILMMFYIMIVLSKFSWPEMRVWLTMMGITNVAMAFSSEYA
jgi:hypothetical protein